MEPVSSTNNSVTQGPAKSHEFNELIKDIHKDIVNLFDITNDNTDDIKRALDIYTVENYALNDRLRTLQGQLNTLLTQVQDIKSGKDTKTLYSALDILLDVKASQEHDIVTLPVNARINKLAILGDDSIYIPDALKVTITESSDGTTYNSVDASTDFIKGEYWARNAIFNASSGIAKIWCKINIEIPVGLTNNPFSNVLKLIPYPRYGATVDSITYTDIAGNRGSISYDGILTVFNDVRDITNLEICISQTNFFTMEDKIVFVYGIKELGLYYYDFANTGSFVVPFSIENTSAFFNTIIEPDAVNGASYQVYTDETLANEIWFDDEIVEYTKKVYLKVNLERKDSIPVVRDIKLPFSVRSAS